MLKNLENDLTKFLCKEISDIENLFSASFFFFNYTVNIKVKKVKHKIVKYFLIIVMPQYLILLKETV